THLYRIKTENPRASVDPSCRVGLVHNLNTLSRTRRNTAMRKGYVDRGRVVVAHHHVRSRWLVSLNGDSDIKISAPHRYVAEKRHVDSSQRLSARIRDDIRPLEGRRSPVRASSGDTSQKMFFAKFKAMCYACRVRPEQVKVGWLLDLGTQATHQPVRGGRSYN